MDKQRREELLKQFEGVGGFVSDVCRSGGPTVDELRALLADSAAVERVEGLSDIWKRSADLADGVTAKDVYEITADDLARALKREDG